MLCFENISVKKTVITSWYYGEKIHPLPCLLLRNSIAIGKTSIIKNLIKPEIH